jgi:hypothetical protein
MDILLLLTTAGSDTGPFDLYENSTGPFVLFESAVDKIDLTTLPGYSTTVPSGTTQVRVQSTGVCPNYIDIVLEQTTTTTTTTALPYSVFVVGFDVTASPSPGGFASNTLACSGSGTPLTLYSNPASTTFDQLISNGHALYTNNTLTTPFDGQGLWYKALSPASNRVVRIDTNGFIDTAIYNC